MRRPHLCLHGEPVQDVLMVNQQQLLVELLLVTLVTLVTLLPLLGTEDTRLETTHTCCLCVCEIGRAHV